MFSVSSHNQACDPVILQGYADKMRATGKIDPALYEKYNVKRGLRNADGTGVLVGLTNIGNVHGYVFEEGVKKASHGKLFYRGISIHELTAGFQQEQRLGFEETAYLLLFGQLPTAQELGTWQQVLAQQRRLPEGFKEDAIMRAPSRDLMNSIARAILMAYNYDSAPDKLDLESTLAQSIALIAQFPIVTAYAYQAKAHYHLGQSLLMRYPEEDKGTAENFLRLIREDGQYSPLEAELLDLCLVVHAEHGGGNNSAFTTHVVSSAFTDTYATVAAATLSLKGMRHGGANLRVMHQMQEIKTMVQDWQDEDEVAAYLEKILAKKAGDGSGLIYGLGHAIYTLSDPRTEILREKARALALVKGRMDEMALYEAIERVGPVLFNRGRAQPRQLCANVDFFSGFVYDMLNIPVDLYTPLFAISRVVGWCAHRIEELLNGGPIIRPAYKTVCEERKYQPLAERG